MGTMAPPLSPEVCARARLSRDPRFDGLFYTAVKTTGIYCRPVCPARFPQESNVIYLFSPAQCEAQGFRPCLRCRPELSPGQHPTQIGLARAYRMPPSRFRRHALPACSPNTPISLRLCYRPPFAFEHSLQWLGSRLIQGVEAIEGQRYLRRIEPGQLGVANDALASDAWFSLEPDPESETAMRLVLHGVNAFALAPVIKRVRRMFDLDANPRAIEASLAQDPRLAPLVQATPGLRIPGAWDGFETAVRAIIGQQISVAAAHTITQRVVQKVGTKIKDPAHPQLTTRFPTPQAMLDANLDGLGLTTRRIESIRAVAQALLDQRVGFELGDDLPQWFADWVALPGIGPWTASYLALRVLGAPDVFPQGDLVLRKALTGPGNSTLTPAKARSIAEAWSPWRSYAAFYLWKGATP